MVHLYPPLILLLFSPYFRLCLLRTSLILFYHYCMLHIQLACLSISNSLCFSVFLYHTIILTSNSICSSCVLFPALLQELGTDVNLYALVFGESVLNDAVSFYCYKNNNNNPGEVHHLCYKYWWFCVLIISLFPVWPFSPSNLLCVLLADGYFSVQVYENNYVYKN